MGWMEEDDDGKMPGRSMDADTCGTGRMKSVVHSVNLS